MIDWQTITVALIVLAAAAYVVRRGWRRLRSFRAGSQADSACATGCGKCPSSTAETPPRIILVGISRSKSSSRS